MIQEKKIVCFGNLTWEGVYVKSTVKLLTHLSKDNEVLYVDYPFTIKDLILAALGKHKLACWKRMLGFIPRVREVESEIGTRIKVLTLPPVFPFVKIKNDMLFRFLLKINSRIIIRSISKTMNRHAISAPVYINAFNQFYGKQFKGKFNEKLYLYYCFDHINLTRDGERGIKYEEEFMPHVDGIITTSDNLKQEKSRFNKNTFLVKNGVDFDKFYALAGKKRETNGKKVVGYVGSIDFRFASEYILYAADQLPEYEFHIVGRNDNNDAVRLLSQVENIKLFEPVPHQQIPAIMRNCHVGLIPYTPSRFTQSVYPLKINEYLAVGTPVVMTNFATLPEFDNIVSVADTKEAFCDAIKRAVELPDINKLNNGLELAKNNSWEMRAQAFSNVISQCLKNMPQKC